MVFPWIVDAHRIFRVVLVLQWLVAVVIGAVFDNIAPALIISIPIIAIPLWLSLTQPASAMSRHAIGLGVQLMAALHIQLAFGLTEMHFEIFALLAFLAYFRDWKVIASSTALVAVHHIGFFVMQSQGASVFIFEEGHVTFYILLLHATFALVEGGVLMLMSHRSRLEGEAAYSLVSAIDRIKQTDGGLNLTVTVSGSDQSVMQFSALISSIRNLVSSSDHLTGQVSRATDTLSQTAGQLEHSAEQVTVEVHSISSATEQIATTMSLTSERAHQAIEKAEYARQQAGDTQQVINQTRETVDSLRTMLQAAARTSTELNERCSNISDAMRSITAVAEQTNLLALNAAIESARAGEHGRGFAVVADEVRTLAIRSKESAEEISRITEQLVNSTGQSVRQVEGCIGLVDDAVSKSTSASDSMSTIMTAVSQASSHLSDVSGSIEEQESASKAIAQSTARVSELVQGNARASTLLSQETKALMTLSAEMAQSLKRIAT